MKREPTAADGFIYFLGWLGIVGLLVAATGVQAGTLLGLVVGIPTILGLYRRRFTP